MTGLQVLALTALVLSVIAVILNVTSLLAYRRRYKRLVGRMSAIRTLHQRSTTHLEPFDYCTGCGWAWPCKTERAAR